MATPATLENLPGPHGRHVDSFKAPYDVENVPDSHMAHSDAPQREEYFPATQVPQTPTTENSPGAHKLQLVAEINEENIPASHLIHELVT